MLSSSRIAYSLGSLLTVVLIVSVASACPGHHHPITQEHAPATTPLKASPKTPVSPSASDRPSEHHALLQEPLDPETDPKTNDAKTGVNADGKPDETRAAIQQGKVLMESHCATCHSLPRPSTHTMVEWPPVLQRMAPRSGLQESDVKLIEQYLSHELNAPPESKTDP